MFVADNAASVYIQQQQQQQYNNRTHWQTGTDQHWNEYPASGFPQFLS